MHYKLEIYPLLTGGPAIFESPLTNSLVIPNVGETLELDGTPYEITKREFQIDSSQSPPVMVVKLNDAS